MSHIEYKVHLQLDELNYRLVSEYSSNTEADDAQEILDYWKEKYKGKGVSIFVERVELQ